MNILQPPSPYPYLSPPNESESPVMLPEDLIIEILSQLNVKSLMRLKCVSKLWKTLISDPTFVEMHLQLSKRNLHLALHMDNRYFGYTYTVAPISVSRLLESTTNPITHAEDPICRFHACHCRGIVGSCNGLICLHSYSFREHWFCFWNPATTSKSVSGSFRYDHMSTLRFGFGYDNSTDTYKVVMVRFSTDGDDGGQVRNSVKVFTLGDNSWREIESFPVEVVFHHRCVLDESCGRLDKYTGVYLSNSISWLICQRYNCHQNNITIEQFVIISLDLASETYTQLVLPQCCDEFPLDNRTLCVLMDCICFSHDLKKIHFVIWQMKEFGIEESWTQFLKISYQNLQTDYKLCEWDVDYVGRLVPLCLSEKGDTLILTINSGDQAILYNWRDNRLKRIKSTYEIWWYSAQNYVESLVWYQPVESDLRDIKEHHRKLAMFD